MLIAEALLMKYRGLLILVVAAVLCTMVPGKADQMIRIGTIPIDSGAEPYYARATGFFHQAGLDVDIQSSAQGAAIAASVASGSLDIGFANIIALATAVQRKVPLTIIAPASLYLSSAPTSVCMVPKTSTIKTAKELDGKVFGTAAIRGTGEFGPRIWIDANGGDSSTVKFVEIPSSAQPAALAEGRFDAELISEPAVAEAKRDGRVLSNCFDAIAPRFLIAAFFATNAWASAHPDLVRKFADVMAKTAAWANRNHDKTAAMYAQEAHANLGQIKSMVRAPYAERLDPKDLQPLIDVTARYGLIPAPFPAAELIYRESGR